MSGGTGGRAPRPPYQLGDQVHGIYWGDLSGTVGAYGQVTACTAREDGRWDLTVRFGDRSTTYRLTANGTSDYVSRALLPPGAEPATTPAKTQEGTR